MKKSAVALLSTFVANSVAFADAVQTQSVALKAGKEISIPVDGRDITLTYQVERKNPDAQLAPEIKVTKAYGGFECELSQTKLLSSKGFASGKVVDTYSVTVDWFPGSDSSGCVVQAGEGDDAAIAEIYMSF